MLNPANLRSTTTGFPPPPNPFGPLNLVIERGQAGTVCRHAQRRRRAAILGVVRSRLSTSGYRRVTVRMIAHDCGVSEQTIANYFGDRAALLAEAVHDYSRAVVRSAENTKGYPYFAFAVIDTYWRCAMQWPTFIRTAIVSQFEPSSPVFDASYTSSRGFYIPSYSYMLKSGLLRGNIDPSVLAFQTNSLAATTMLEWAYNAYATDDFRRTLRLGLGYLLLGLLNRTESAKLEQWMDSAQG
jgi:AcrR family transcriptional regulator